MQVEPYVAPNGPRTFSIKATETESTGYGRFVIIDSDTTNCKLSYIHGAGCLSIYKDNQIKESIDILLKYCKGCVILNTTQKKIVEVIQKHYPVYYSHNVPIGYGTNYQYHICFKNTIKENSNCRGPETNTPAFAASGKTLDIGMITNKLNEILKKKRRKNDFVDEFIKSLK